MAIDSEIREIAAEYEAKFIEEHRGALDLVKAGIVAYDSALKAIVDRGAVSAIGE